jgi:hypothetical protein
MGISSLDFNKPSSFKNLKGSFAFYAFFTGFFAVK